MLLRIFAIIVGIFFIFMGVATFAPSLNTNGLVFGYFEVSFLHSISLVITGVIAIMAAIHYKYSKLYFQVFGIIYALIAIVGFLRSGDLYIMHVNLADNFLNLFFAIIALYVGFFLYKNTQRS